MKRIQAAVVGALLLIPAPGAAQDSQSATSSVFRRFGEYVVKIQVVENGSGAKATVGSGFFVTANGHVVTNYHVISKLVHDPDRYHAELIDAGGAERPITIAGVDVVHDLAVVHSETASPRYFTLAAISPDQGTRLYSFGHPSDLGLTIVEGTYNGLLRHSMYEKIHFTGSINPGMSGGPTLTADGAVVGINVSTAGNQLSFLVPVDRARALLATVTAATYVAPTSFLDVITRQITAYQATYLDGMFGPKTKTVKLGRYQVPTQPTPFFRCWADAERKPSLTYETINHNCSTDDYLYISGDQQSGVVSVSHELVTSRQLNMLRFYSLYSGIFARDKTPSGEREHVTKWKCSTTTIDAGSGPARTVLCVRAYRKLNGLYDAVLKAAPLGRHGSGIVSTLTLSGVTYDNIGVLSRRYVERMSWH
jgi:serine protease Do